MPESIETNHDFNEDHEQKSREHSTPVENIRHTLEQTFPFEQISKGVAVHNLEMLKQRYELALDFLAETESIRLERIESNPDIKNTWIESRWPKPASIMEGIGEASYHFNEDPFTTYNLGRNFHESLETLFDHQPEIIAVTPKSGILPSIIIKSAIDEYDEMHHSDWDPYFFIPSKKLFKLENYSNQGGQSYGLNEHLYQKVGSNELSRQLGYIIEVYEGKVVDTETDDLIEECKRIRDILQEHVDASKKEIRMAVFDEYISQGRSARGLKFLFEVGLEMLKRDGLANSDIQLNTKLLQLGREATSYNLPGEGFISDDNFGTKPGSDEKHWLARSLFKLVGTYAARDYQVMKKQPKRY